jgi:sorbitol-specific phosphotransferase system component IIA
VLERDSEVEATPCARFPLRYLLAILESRIKNVGRAAPDMGSLQMPIVGEAGAPEDFDGSKLCLTLGHMIPKVDCMV